MLVAFILVTFSSWEGEQQQPGGVSYNSKPSSSSSNSSFSCAGASASAGSGKDSVPIISTPAEDIRRMFRRDGFNTLSLEEQQWCIMDQALNPHKYEWLREAEEEEREYVTRKE